MLYVYTSIVDGFDNLRPPACPVDSNVRYICFTNVPNLPRVFPWEYRPIYPVGESHRTARVAKILPHLMLPEDAKYSIYHDGNFQLRQDPNQIIDLVSRDVHWAAHRHPSRKCIYQEAKVILDACPLVPKDSVTHEIEGYQREGFMPNSGLWANGFIVRKHTPEVAQLNEDWWRLFQDGCGRDQLSFPVARQRLNMRIRTIDADVFSSPYIKFNWHAAWADKDDNPDYWPERDRTRQRLARLAVVTESLGGVKFQQY